LPQATSRETGETRTDGKFSGICCDTKGELTQITDPLNNVTHLTYNAVGLISTITDAQSNVTTYAYDQHGNLTNKTDHNGHSIL
jgi:YD repeat-containing protein